MQKVHFGKKIVIDGINYVFGDVASISRYNYVVARSEKGAEMRSIPVFLRRESDGARVSLPFGIIQNEVG